MQKNLFISLLAIIICALYSNSITTNAEETVKDSIVNVVSSPSISLDERNFRGDNKGLVFEKYDSYIQFNEETQVFSLLDTAYKSLTSEEINTILSQLAQTNELTRQISMNSETKSNLQISTNSEGLIIEEKNSNKLRFKEGKTAIAFYWWGTRCWIKKSHVKLGTGLTIANIWIPHPVIKSAVFVLGFACGNCPGGIVFNFSPGPTLTSTLIWGYKFQ